MRSAQYHGGSHEYRGAYLEYHGGYHEYHGGYALYHGGYSVIILSFSSFPQDSGDGQKYMFSEPMLIP